MGATVPDMNEPPATDVPPIRSLRILVGTLAGSVVIFGIVLYSVHESGDYPPIWVAWALGGLAATSHLLSRRVGFNLKPVPAGTPPDEAMAMARVAFQASTVLRFALTEAVAIVALVLSFAVQPASWMTYLIGAVLALVLLAANVWPSAGIIGKTQQQLDREGGQSFLQDALLGVAPGTTPPTIISS
jgi:hypothetical protein